MKQFFGAFFGSIIGLVIATLLAVLIIVAVIKTSIGTALKSEQEESAIVKPNSLLHITLNGPLEDREVENPFGELKKFSNLSEEEGKGLNVLIKKINYAKEDSNIKGIYLEIKDIGSGYANIAELRSRLIDFKKSGKFIYCYSECYGQHEYYLASIANKIFLHPQGLIEFKGLSMNIMFFKNAFQKLGIEAQTFRHGKFKSAIEPFILDKMSEANRLQSKVFLNSIWNNILEGISKERKLSIEQLNSYADNLEIQDPQSAVGNLIDATVFEDEVLLELKAKIGILEKNKLNLVELRRYENRSNRTVKASLFKIAVIYAEGSIKSGEGNDDEIGSDRLAKAIKDARLDERVKAIVLRVNSPGGSALASDVIWREVTLAKKSKPFIVSMGNLAASGGYYISCAADRIFAQPNTITGSIGVFGFLPNIKKAMEEKLGITIDTVNTNKYSTVGTALFPVRDKERAYIQSGVEKVYDTFISRVAEGRNMDKSAIDSIGQGRVWTGNDALKINLVDELGGLNEAIAYAAKKAKLPDYRIIELPRPKNPFAHFLGKTEEEAETCIMKKNLGLTYSYLKQLREIISIKGIQARLPFEMVIE
jgi:protease-4